MGSQARLLHVCGQGGRVAAARIALQPDTVTGRLLSLGPVLLLLALITPLLGMYVDHHFVERIPGHGHFR